MQKVLFIAGLSNGETVTEGKGNFQRIEGELSPWQRLLAFLDERPEIQITSLSLSTKDGKRWNIPSLGKSPKFHAFSEAVRPNHFHFFRKMGGDVTGPNKGVADHFAVIEAEYDSYVLQLWVDEHNLTCWTLIKEKDA